MGYNGNYSINLIMIFLSLVYMVFLVKEPVSTKEPQPFTGIGNFLKEYLVQPCWEMFRMVFKPREGCLRFLLIVQVIAYGIMKFANECGSLQYLYMLKVFDGYNKAEYAYYSAGTQIVHALWMLFVMPMIKVHESLYNVVALLGTVLSCILVPWMSAPWQYYLAHIFTIGCYGVWASARTIFTYCVDVNDIGKIYAAIGIVSGIAPLISNPIYRPLYSKVSYIFGILDKHCLTSGFNVSDLGIVSGCLLPPDSLHSVRCCDALWRCIYQKKTLNHGKSHR